MSNSEPAASTGGASEAGVGTAAWLGRSRTGWDHLAGTLEVIEDRVRYTTAQAASEKMARWLEEASGETAGTGAQQEGGLTVLDVPRAVSNRYWAQATRGGVFVYCYAHRRYL